MPKIQNRFSCLRYVGHRFLYLLIVFAPCSYGAERYSGYFEEIEESRDQALQEAVISVTRDALGNLIRDENWNPNILACLEDWIVKELSPRYRNLISNQLFDLDQEINNQWALEGSMSIEMGFLNRWVQQQLTDPACGPRLQQRRTVYIQSLNISDAETSEIVTSALNYIEQTLIRSGYEIVDESRRQYAQFKLSLESVEMAARGQVKTLNVAGYYIDNRVDGQPFLAINTSVDDRLRTTELALNNSLYERQSQSVLAQIREWEATHVIDNTQIELVFVSRQEAEIYADQLLDEVSSSLNLPAEFTEQTDAIQISNLDNSIIEISILIPAHYGISLNRSSKRDIQRLADEVLGYDVAASIFTNNATKLTIFDASSVQEEWEKSFWVYLDSGKLMFPNGGNAYAVVRNRLLDNANDIKAQSYLDEIISRLVQRAIGKIGQNALNSAGADLTLAESVGQGREDKPWEVARRELDAAIARQQAEAVTGSIILVENSNGVSASSSPLLIFPQLEGLSTRGVSIAENRGLLGITADIAGIKSIKVNETSVEFDPVTSANEHYLTVPGASTKEFYLSPAITAGVNELRLVVTDGNDEVTERLLGLSNGEYVILDSNKDDNSDSALLRDGEDVLTGKYHALLIANQDYQRINSLATPINDAEKLRDVLVELYSFEADDVRLVINGSKAEIELAIDRLQERVNPNDSVLIYYAGHGYQDLGLDGTGYWIPADGMSDTERDHRTSWVSNTYVADYVDKLRAKHVLLISDSCYAGTFAQRGNESDYYMFSKDYFQRKAGLTSRRAITSGDIEPVQDGGGNGHSIFAHYMLTVLRESQGSYLTGERLYRSIFSPVLDNAPQTPQYFVMADRDDGGDFVFVPRNNN